MTDDQFWNLIEQSRDGIPVATTDEALQEKQITQLRVLLSALGLDEIKAFNAHFDRCMEETYRWDLWAVAVLMHNGYCSDDSFAYFCCWVIAQGRSVYGRTLAEPDVLVRFLPAQWSCYADMEGIWGVAKTIYEEKTGEVIELGSVNDAALRCGITEPRGKRWESEDLPRLLPLTWTRFGDSGDTMAQTRDTPATLLETVQQLCLQPL